MTMAEYAIARTYVQLLAKLKARKLKPKFYPLLDRLEMSVVRYSDAETKSKAAGQ